MEAILRDVYLCILVIYSDTFTFQEPACSIKTEIYLVTLQCVHLVEEYLTYKDALTCDLILSISTTLKYTATDYMHFTLLSTVFCFNCVNICDASNVVLFNAELLSVNHYVHLNIILSRKTIMANWASSQLYLLKIFL